MVSISCSIRAMSAGVRPSISFGWSDSSSCSSGVAASRHFAYTAEELCAAHMSSAISICRIGLTFFISRMAPAAASLSFNSDTASGQMPSSRSLLMARRLVEAGVNLVQVNLGNNETWDTHGNAFPHLKDNLFPPTDKALSALLDDLSDSGLLDSTMIVMAGEFGRTPQISGGGTAIYKTA